MHNAIWIRFKLNLPKEEAKEYLYHTASNYNLGTRTNLKELENYKKEILYNAIVHTVPFLISIGGCFFEFGCNLPLAYTFLGFSIAHFYCVMLQRYNWIRVDEVLKQAKKIENNRKISVSNSKENQIQKTKDRNYTEKVERKDNTYHQNPIQDMPTNSEDILKLHRKR